MPFHTANSLKGGYENLSRYDLDTIHDLFSDALSSAKYVPGRSDSPTDILRDVVYRLDSADLVLADITSLNPNVMYELGIRHTLCKKTVMVSQDRKEIPFDLGGYTVIEYGWKTSKEKKEFKENLLAHLKKLEKEQDPRYGPVHTHLGTQNLAFDDYEKRTTLSKLECLVLELGHLMTGVETVLEKLPTQFPDVYKETDSGYECIVEEVPVEVFNYLGNGINPSHMHTPCIDLILSTGYINSEFDAFGDITEFVWTLQTLKAMHFHISIQTIPYYAKTSELLCRLSSYSHKIMYAIKNDIKNQKILGLEYDITETLSVKKFASERP